MSCYREPAGALQHQRCNPGTPFRPILLEVYLLLRLNRLDLSLNVTSRFKMSEATPLNAAGA